MKPLLEINHPKHLRRLVREVNSQRLNGTRIYGVDAITGEHKEIRRLTFNGAALWANGTWPVKPDSLKNNLGEDVCASRKA